MSSSVLFLTEEDVKFVLNWNEIFQAIEQVMSDISNKTLQENNLVVQPARGFMHMPHKNGVFLTMPGFSERKKVLSCKLVTSFVNNFKTYGLPSILANILIFDPDNGKLKAVIEGTTITEWRTATASAVATYHLKKNVGKDQTLAVMGAGAQARIHIIAFQHFFKFKKINLWNRTYENGVKLANDLKKLHNIHVEVFSKSDDCVKDADIIITATYASEPILKYTQLKKNIMINAVGAGVNHHSELDKSVYEKSAIYTDSMENASKELKGLIDEGFVVLGEIGEILNGHKEVIQKDIIIFHSLGMALEDGVTAQLVFDNYIKKKNLSNK